MFVFFVFVLKIYTKLTTSWIDYDRLLDEVGSHSVGCVEHHQLIEQHFFFRRESEGTGWILNEVRAG
jgi:hypothetical protein